MFNNRVSKFARPIAIATLCGLVPAVALAGLSVGDMTGTEEAEIQASLEAAGYEVLEIEFEDAELEAEVVLGGVAYELEIDPSTGQIISIELED